MLLKDGIEAVKTIEPVAGIPVSVKLVEREKDIAKIFERFGPHVMQPKFDGLRAEIHYSRKGFANISAEQGLLVEAESDHVRIFSRRMENLTDMFPDLIRAVSYLNVDSVILDSEAIAYDPASGELLPFQETMKRKRKNDIAEMAEQIPIQAHCFDILMLNGKSLLRTPLEERLRIMNDLLKDSGPTLIASESPEVKTVEDAQEVFDRYVEMDLEGIISKGYGTFYDPGTRNYDWIKLKAAANSELADTVDAVVLGYYLGSGARAKFGIGAILIGVPDKKTGEFVSLSKVGTGITDAQFADIRNRLDTIRIDTMPVNVRIAKPLLPDVFVRPEVVVVVEADSISKSKLHGSEGGGYSLRFPRLKVFDRQDKSPEDATSLQELEHLMELAGQ
ncbi:MAG: putative DNA ligase-like protein [candidate division WS6 bacterium OLB20]|uniref:DNA ligase (ATP) n=1 Tax=candidate division WS6 bacterium OLB20 TaxID=1617426 RepID=A0A136LYK2_9BACT|nr:MAG: putative DNA ligase-like protein [candidate division WS6 bacterium OLB20]